MSQLRILGIAILVGAAVYAGPAAAQGRGASSSLVHVVSVTVPARVKVKVSSPLAVSVNSNKAWVLSVSAPSGESSRGSKLQWSGTHTDTTVFLPRGKTGSAAASAVPILLTVSAP
jgi:hypothetical protein